MRTRALLVTTLIASCLSLGCGGDRSPSPPPDGGSTGGGGKGGGGGSGGSGGGASGGDGGGERATPPTSGAWTRRFPYLGDHVEEAPGWLTSRPGFGLRNTRGARGYALLSPALVQSDDCSQRVELLAPSGRLCGRVTLKGDGGACTTSLVDQGWDGTVVQESARDHCAWRFWPRLLAGD